MTLKSIEITEKASTALSQPDEMGQIIESVIACGDLARLDPRERTRYYSAVCKSLGLNPMTRPFEYIVLNGKLTLYARKDATDQLRSIYDVSVLEMTETERDGLMVVTVKVRNAKGRTDMAKGAASLAGLKGDALANQIMKIETKAKRRATLSICGLGFLDETEIETIPAASLSQAAQPTQDDPVAQGTAEWLKMRCGKVTASRIADVTARAKNGSGWLKPRADYMMELVSERLTGQPTECYVSPAMQWGSAQEPAARLAYSRATGREIASLAFVDHPSVPMSGASPDGLIGTDGLVEIKCPTTSTHLAFLEAKAVPADYVKQIMWQLACTERQWCDFVSYDPRVPEGARLAVVRVNRDDKMIAELEEQVKAFLTEVEAKLAQLAPKEEPQQSREEIVFEINALLASHGFANGSARASMLLRHFGASTKAAFEKKISLADLRAGHESLRMELEASKVPVPTQLDGGTLIEAKPPVPVAPETVAIPAVMTTEPDWIEHFYGQ